MTIKEVKEMKTESIITAIFYMGIVMSGGRQIKKLDRELEIYCKELARREVVPDGDALYISMCK